MQVHLTYEGVVDASTTLPSAWLLSTASACAPWNTAAQYYIPALKLLLLKHLPLTLAELRQAKTMDKKVYQFESVFLSDMLALTFTSP